MRSIAGRRRETTFWATNDMILKMKGLSKIMVVIRGAGEIASGIAYCLYRYRISVCLTEVAAPLSIVRGVTFSEAVFDTTKTIMGVTAELVAPEKKEIHRVWQRKHIPLVIDPEASIKEKMKPNVLVDAILAKRNTSTRITDAPLVIGVGPGFYAGRDVHVVVESNHNNSLGKLIFDGEAERNTGIPVSLGGLDRERVLWAPRSGLFTSGKNIGESVAADEHIAQVGDVPLRAPISGVLRGLLRSDMNVVKGTKLVEIDPIHDNIACNFITDKANTIGEGVLEAIRLKFGDGSDEMPGVDGKLCL